MNDLQIIFRIFRVRWLLKRHNYTFTVNRLSTTVQSSTSRVADINTFATHIVIWCDRISGTRCLARSLVLWSLLREYGVTTELRIGIKPVRTGIEAHAWVEYQGMPLCEADDLIECYTPFDGDLSNLQFKS
jgi:hypothetical protein